MDISVPFNIRAEWVVNFVDLGEVHAFGFDIVKSHRKSSKIFDFVKDAADKIYMMKCICNSKG